MTVRSIVALCAAALALVLTPHGAAAVDPGSQLIPCDQADEPITIDVSSHLDPSCTWTRGVEIVASDVTLDCQGALIAAPDRRYGVHIVAPTDVALENITVRNCHVEGFLNNYHIEREGFRELAEGVEYEHAFSNIVIEDSTSLNSRGVGIFVNGYVTGVTLRNLHVEGASSTGIYLEAGSKDNVVENNEIVNNGYGENSPSGQIFEFAGTTFWFWGTGREGLAIDGSRFNTVRNNYFTGNSAGGIFLYKNCGEFVNQRPQRWWHRRYGADGNLIESNTFVGEDNGVWIASRMGQSVLPMDCSDPPYGPVGIVLDHADDNVVRDNDFENVIFGVRVEDDDNTVSDNEFVSSNPVHQAIVIGTRFRTPLLNQPVDGTTITGNRAFIAGTTNPYRWVDGHTNTVFSDNESQGRPVGLCEGEQPPTGPFVMTVDLVPADPENPPVGPPKELPLPELLPPCPGTCESGSEIEKSSIVLKNLDTPPGDDRLSITGQLAVPYPFSPVLDPIATGVGVVIEDAGGERMLEATLPGGVYDPATKVGWTTSVSGNTWKYRDRRAAPTGGITALTVKHLERRQPGLVRIRVTGKRGSYPVDVANLPLTGLVILDPPTAETGQCGRTAFTAPSSCRATVKSIMCR